MARILSIFNAYAGKENRVTNYCGLILKILYERSPRAFDDAVVRLTAGTVQISTRVSFVQQERGSRSVPDLVIRQEPFVLYFENKRSDWHYSDQIDRHLASIRDRAPPSEREKRVLFLLAKFDSDEAVRRFEPDILKASRDGVHLIPLSYDEYVRALDLADSQRLITTELDEFRAFLDQQSLLPTWRGLLDVVNCRQSMNEVEEDCYMCPDTGGPYSHRRARFFGPYANKRVQAVFQIDGVVSVDREFNARTTRYRNSAEPESDLNKRAIAKVRKWRSDEVEKYSIQVFLLSNKAQT
ncbi:MAG: hypothetical protein ACJ8EC_11385, partial [Microvirga sp.]